MPYWLVKSYLVGIKVQFLASTSDFSPVKYPDRLIHPHTLLLDRHRELSPDIKQLGVKLAKHSPPLTAEFKNEWSYRVRQKYLTILQNSCEWNRWRREFVLERSSSETQSIWVATERWSVEHRAFAVETYFKNNDSVLTQRIFRRHFNIHQNECP